MDEKYVCLIKHPESLKPMSCFKSATGNFGGILGHEAHAFEKVADGFFSGSDIAGFYGVYNINFEIGKLEDPSKYIDYTSCGDDQ